MQGQLATHCRQIGARRAGLRVQSKRIDSRAVFAHELQGDWDLILSDYNLPGFSGLQALELLRASGRL
ncbi:MAG TPA: hypothetical protein P5195_07815, partial [Anaerolineae bacterium]|nr:hypothetical protein [Anaerolineae bacterium]